MTSPRPSSSVCSAWQRLGSSPEISASFHLGLHPPPSSGGLRWAAAAVSSAWAASAAPLAKPVLVRPSAGVGAARSGDVPGVHEGASGSGGGDGSAGDEAEDEDGVLDAGAGVGRSGEVAVSGADEDVSAYDGVASGPAVSSSFPSCGPWCSYSRSTWRQGGESVLPSISFWLPNALEGLEVKHKDY